MLKKKDWLIAAVLVLALVIIYAVVIALAPSGAEFVGTDATANELLDAEPWFEPLFSPGDLGGELESGLFALQAGLGGVLLGFALGRLGRRNAAVTTPAE
ncbi:MAG: energy-coupling factor ABC transporter substrate-binding protein [Propionibacteriaceae bacterium]|nr:energy-coupling factor ABC transporter substrate-binding protein [Propionibacteriaceae bacterium]